MSWSTYPPSPAEIALHIITDERDCSRREADALLIDNAALRTERDALRAALTDMVTDVLEANAALRVGTLNAARAALAGGVK